LNSASQTRREELCIVNKVRIWGRDEEELRERRRRESARVDGIERFEGRDKKL